VSDLSVKLVMQDASKKTRDVHQLHGVPDSEIGYTGPAQWFSQELTRRLDQFRQALFLYQVQLLGTVKKGAGVQPIQNIDVIVPEATTSRLALGVTAHGLDGADVVYVKDVVFQRTFTITDASNGHPVLSDSTEGKRAVNRKHQVIPVDPAGTLDAT